MPPSPPADAHAPDLHAGPPGVEELPLRLHDAAPPIAGTVGAPPAELRQNRDFLVVLFGQGISSFGDSITNTAMPILVLLLTGSGFAMGVVGVLSTLPDLILGLPAGAYADRWDRRKMMLGADVGRAILTALVPITVAIGGPAMAVIILVTFPLNVLRVLWLAAYTAAVPGLVGRDQVPRANAVFEAVFTVGWVVGPALAGLLAATIGPGATIAIDALTFAISAGAMLLVRRPLRPEARAEPTHILEDVREGVRFVAHQPTLRAVLALWTTTSVVTAGLTAALIFYITIDRKLGEQVVGLVLSAWALGSLGGSLIAARLAPKRVGAVMLAGAATNGVAILLVVATPIPLVAAAAAFIAGSVNSLVLVAYISLRTLLSPDALLGRVGATARTLSVGLMPFGSLVAGLALDAVGGTKTLAAIGVLLVAASMLFTLRPAVRTARLTS
jgi:MFS transporter, ENTS family, enterobactin (siderophore) exporter